MKKSIYLKYLFVILPLVFVIFLAGCGGLLTPATDEAIIKVDILAVDKSPVDTDLPDYSPGDYVLVTGSGWLPGETVKLDFLETLSDLISQQTITYYTVADGEGNISDSQYLIELRHLGATFILTATGQTSGLVATTTFTDAVGIDSVKSSGLNYPPEINSFLTSENVYAAVSASGSGSNSVRIYVVSPLPSSGGALTDVSGGYESVTISTGTGTYVYLIWSAPTQAGDYYIVVDANESGSLGGSEKYDSFSVTAPVDNTPPDTSITGGPTGWINTTSATFEWTGSDNVTPTANLVYSWNLDSGTWSAYSATTTTTLSSLSEGSHTFYVKAKDAAGNEDSTPASRSFNVDITPPVITPTITGTLGDDDWYVSDVTVSWSISDPESGIASSTGAETTTLNADTSGTTLTCSATNGVGLTNSVSVTIKIDKTAPTVTWGIPSPAPNAYGWNKTDVSYPFTINDSLSGPDDASSSASPLIISAEGSDVKGSVTVYDLAGNHESYDSPLGVNIDKTAPEVTITLPGTGEYILNQPVSDATWNAIDDLSGVVPPDTGAIPIDTSSVGTKTLTAPAGTAVDYAGNESSEEQEEYSVIYNWIGFFSPVDNPNVLNGAKAGSAIPVKFSLDGDQGLDIFQSGYPRSVKIVCNTTTLADDIEETVTAGGSSLHYDAIANQYIYVWKTDKAWANSCRKLEVKLEDGKLYYAYFTFKK